MLLESTELELAAIGISIAAGCVPCTKYHITEAGRSGASRLEILEALRNGVGIANTALSDMHRQFDPQAVSSFEDDINTGLSRCAILTGIGSSVASNSVQQLNIMIGLARNNQIQDKEIMEIVGLANRIKEKAASHLVRVTDQLDADPEIAQEAAQLCS